DYSNAQRNGARMVVIDPRFNETAAKADEWVPIVPGTDIALALGMINIIMQEKRYDADFLRAHTGAVYLVDGQQKLMRADPQDTDSYLVFDTLTQSVKRHDAPGVIPALLNDELPNESDFTTVLDNVWAQAKPWTTQKVE
ncbi:molybdopterin-dependent oxidoreductase, partial [Escherichia coli]